MGDLTRIGSNVKSGNAEYLDPRAAAAWLAAVDLIDARLGIDLSKRILQALGDAKASAGVHRAPGVCVDIRVWGLTRAQINAVVALLRECGFAGTWYRDWKGNQHIHAATDIGVWTPARYQITAVKAGYDGLGSGGKQGKDTHPKPSAWRTAQTGAAWARAQLEEDMAITDADIAKIADRTTKEMLGRLLGRSGPTVAVALQSTYRATRDAAVDVDESLIATQVAAIILAPLTASLTAKLDGIAGVDPKVLAAEVVAELGAALQA